MAFKKTEKILKSKKAYDNFEFIHSSDGRILRMIAEYIYPDQYFRKKGVKGAIVFYGSARTFSMEEYNKRMDKLNDSLKKTKTNERSKVEKEIIKLKAVEDMCRYHDDATTLSKMLSEWLTKEPLAKGIYVTTGGGGGMMEAANKGAELANLDNIGLNISLPFEQHPNQHISPHFNFEFHYFFMRKFWFVYLAKAIVTMPGGFGTLDELMEILTLRQTLKVTKPLPIVLYGSDFWKKLINMDFLIEKQLISPEDLNLFKYVDTPEEAFNFIKGEMEKTLKKKTKKLTLN